MESWAHPSGQRPKQRPDPGRFREVAGVPAGYRRVFSGSHLPESNFHSSPCPYSTALRFYTPAPNSSVAEGQGGSLSPCIFCGRALLPTSTPRPLTGESGSDAKPLKGRLQRRLGKLRDDGAVGPRCGSFPPPPMYGVTVKNRK